MFLVENLIDRLVLGVNWLLVNLFDSHDSLLHLNQLV